MGWEDRPSKWESGQTGGAPGGGGGGGAATPVWTQITNLHGATLTDNNSMDAGSTAFSNGVFTFDLNNSTTVTQGYRNDPIYWPIPVDDLIPTFDQNTMGIALQLEFVSAPTGTNRHGCAVGLFDAAAASGGTNGNGFGVYFNGTNLNIAMWQSGFLLGLVDTRAGLDYAIGRGGISADNYWQMATETSEDGGSTYTRHGCFEQTVGSGTGKYIFVAGVKVAGGSASATSFQVRVYYSTYSLYALRKPN